MMWLYRLVLAFILATVTVNANYTISKNQTLWRMATCNLAEPNLTYDNKSYQVDSTTVAQIQNANVWIGYQLAKMPFLFLGCGSWNTGKTYNITSIGDCYHLCGGGTFEIKATGNDDILSNHTYKECRCVTATDLGNGNQNRSCDRVSFPSAVFSPINVISSEVSTSHNTSGDCLLYYYPKFLWGPCEQTHYIKVMCSTCKGSNTTAESFDDPTGQKNSWSAANDICLKHNYHPASIKSITNSYFSTVQMQYYWTGIIRSTALIKSTSAKILTIYPVEQFAFFKTVDRVLKFARNDVDKKALCMQGLPTTENSISPYSTDDVCTYEHSTTEESVTREFPIGVGIGVAVGILCIVGTVVGIFVLRRRGILSCKLRTKTAEPEPVNLAFASRSYEETVGNHNYFILEKSIQSIRGHAEHYNTAEEPKEDNLETDHYNSINDTEEPYQSVKDDYDYTSNAVRTEPNTRKPDAIYNKLKLDRPGDYDHVAGLGYNMSQPGSDYDTSALARTNAGGDDYNHITTAC